MCLSFTSDSFDVVAVHYNLNKELTQADQSLSSKFETINEENSSLWSIVRKKPVGAQSFWRSRLFWPSRVAHSGIVWFFFGQSGHRPPKSEGARTSMFDGFITGLPSSVRVPVDCAKNGCIGSLFTRRLDSGERREEKRAKTGGKNWRNHRFTLAFPSARFAPFPGYLNAWDRLFYRWSN